MDTDKYEVYSITGSQSYIDKQLQYLQNDGWIIAGPIVPSYDPERQITNCSIAFKRKIK